MTFADDLRAEGEPEKEFHAGIAGRLPRKRVSGGAFLRRESGELLVVVPTYKPGWEIPGGLCEENEGPLAACTREVREELGLDVVLGNLLVVDWVPRHGVWVDALHFIFDGGFITDEAVRAFRLQAEEIQAVKLAHLSEVEKHVRPSMARRLHSATDAAARGETLYLEFGRQRDGDDVAASGS